MPKQVASIRNRVRELRQVRAGELRPNPANWRKHPHYQVEAMRGVLAEIGYADALLAREKDGHLELLDGHLRADLDPHQVVPVLILDLDDAEASKLLLTLDPLASMAQPDNDALMALLQSTEFESQAVKDMLEALANSETFPMPNLGLELDESLANGVSLCICKVCGNEHIRVSK